MLTKNSKDNFQKDFFKLSNNLVFRKTMKTVTKHRNVKLVTKERSRNYLVSEPKYETTKFSKENLLARKMRKTQILINKLVYLGLPILNLSKTVIYKFWYDYVKPKYDENEKLSYIDRDSFIVYVKTDNVYKDIAENVGTNCVTSNFELERPFPKGKNKKSNGINER